MIKQLNKLKVTTIIGVAFFAIFSINSIVIAQENISNSSTTLVAEMPFLNQDMVLGDPKAPVEIIEYASLTCNHCATFHNFVLPKIKDKYVDTGKVKVVMRSFLLNAIDASASILTRCVPEKRYFKFMEILFTQQTQWYDISEYQKLSGIHDQRTANNIFVQSTIDKVSKVANRLGINNRKIEACLLNEKIGDYLYSVHQEGIQKYKVTATPTILVNGNKTGNTYAAVEKAIEAALEYQ
ncbi:MAG: thioredoxin domain-containing protein [Emcibacteraceae bacterium]|jgi:protein-disulfide isomerase|tara:strand:+ start:937 stop:1653 length:717 start_codon:yes stop_codon:yes gene_type:complete